MHFCGLLDIMYMQINNKCAVIKYLFKQIFDICLNRYLITARLLAIVIICRLSSVCNASVTKRLKIR